MSRYAWEARLFACAVAMVVWLGAGEADSTAPGRTPAVVGVVPAGSQWTLAPLDPRTLEPVRGAWSYRLRAFNALVRSPRGTAVVASGRRTIFVDTRTERPLRRSSSLVAYPSDVYWVGGERVVGRGRASIYSVFQDTGSLGGIWYQYNDLAGPDGGGATADRSPRPSDTSPPSSSFRRSRSSSARTGRDRLAATSRSRTATCSSSPPREARRAITT